MYVLSTLVDGRDRLRLGWPLVRAVIVIAATGIVVLGVAGVASAQTAPCTPGTRCINTPQDVTFSPSGQLLATANTDTDTVSVFVVGADGTLQEAFGSPFQTGGKGPQSVAFSPNGNLLAVANYSSDDVSMFSVAANGTLTRVGSPVHTGGAPSWVAWSPEGFLAVTNWLSDTVVVYAVGAGGAMHQVDTKTLGPQPCGPAANYSPLCAGPVAVRFSPDGGLLATATRATTRCRCSRSAPAARWRKSRARRKRSRSSPDPAAIRLPSSGT